VEQVSAAFTVAPALLDRWRRWCEDAAVWPPAPAVIHGDLHAGHVLIDEAQRVTGLIDWTEARIGDPALDLLSHRVQFGDAALDSLLDAYERAGGQVWPRIKEHLAEREAAFAIDVGLFALRSGREDMRELAIQLLGAG
jgi:macrolide phosphotransferase